MQIFTMHPNGLIKGLFPVRIVTLPGQVNTFQKEIILLLYSFTMQPYRKITTNLFFIFIKLPACRTWVNTDRQQIITVR